LRPRDKRKLLRKLKSKLNWSARKLRKKPLLLLRLLLKLSKLLKRPKRRERLKLSLNKRLPKRRLRKRQKLLRKLQLLRKKLISRLLKMLLRKLLWLSMRLKLPDLRPNKRNKISRMQRTLNLFNRRLRHMPLKLLPKRRKIKKKKNFSRPTKPNLELVLQARLNSNKPELKNSKLTLKQLRRRLRIWPKSKLNLPRSNSSNNVSL